MKRSWDNCSKRSRPRAARRRATTLIEVLAGLVILGTLLASAAVSRGRFLRQWAQADRRLKAAHAVDAMLAQWMPGTAGAPPVPVPAAGELAGAPGHVWRTRWVRDAAAAQLGAKIVRLEVFDRAAGAAAASDETAPAGAPLLAVEFLVHDAGRPPTPPVAGAAPRAANRGSR